MNEVLPSSPFGSNRSFSYAPQHRQPASSSNLNASYAAALDPHLQAIDYAGRQNEAFGRNGEQDFASQGPFPVGTGHVSRPDAAASDTYVRPTNSDYAPADSTASFVPGTAPHSYSAVPSNPLVNTEGDFVPLEPGPSTPSHRAQATENGRNVPSSPAQPGTGDTREGAHIERTNNIPNPQHLEAWRQRLFDVDDTIMLTEEQFQTYFPHVDNVYSHRSTQKYKRKPFVSHYWDCRLKGRPPGTPKSEDPTKKKRKRQQRERDLCDVKIKITEYFAGARATMRQTGERPNDGLREAPVMLSADATPMPVPDRSDDANLRIPGADGMRFYTICRVSGGNEADGEAGVPGRHRHTLSESDRIKKSSIQRELLKQGKVQKQGQARFFQQKTYHKKATGTALATVRKHAKEHELKLYGSCFCPFVQRVWIALELKGLTYQYIEVDPYKKPASLLALSPKGLVPALQHGSFYSPESMVLLEYLDEVFPSPSLLGDTPAARARARLWADHIAKAIVPAFYRTLQAQESTLQTQHAIELRDGIDVLVRAADASGPFFAGARLGWVDIVLAPWLLRLRRVLGPYRSWPAPEPGSRWARWVAAVEDCEAVRVTTSGDELYLDSYERYAENRPNTSQLADAINSGRPLP